MKFFFIVFFILWIGSLEAQSQASFQLSGPDIKVSFDFYKGSLRLLGILPAGYYPIQKILPLSSTGNDVALQCTGENKGKHIGSAGLRLKFIGKHENVIKGGKQIIIQQQDTVNNLLVESYYEFNNVSPVIHRYTKVTNEGKVAVGIENLSSAMLYNYSNILPGTINDNLKISYAYNGSLDEAQWKTNKPYELGLDDNSFQYFHNDISFSSLGTRSTSKYIPMGMIENTKAGITWFWQIEHNGSWFWKMSSSGAKNEFVYIGGPDEQNSQAWKNLKPGESYQSVPVALGCVKGGMNEAVAALTSYRRAVVIRPHQDDVKCPVIFNDYMNCLFADPTTEKEQPLIDAAAKLKAEYYVIDAGWHAELNEKWGEAVGMWEPSKTRFKGGLGSLIDYIRKKGMKPGLWIEFEVVGSNSPLKTKPDNWFLMRHGKRVIDGGRYLLDFRNPEVGNYITGVFDRLIKDFGVKYFKVDYNSGEFIGTDYDADSPGQGLLAHNRALIQWYKDIYKKYPDLVIESCGSGGARFDYATLSQTQLESFSDQSNYKKAPAIIVGELAAILPEQLGVFVYPKADGDAKSASFNMVDAMFCRVYLSGMPHLISAGSLAQIESGLEVYNSVFKPIIHQSTPFFPLGMPSMTEVEKPIALGLKAPGKTYIAVWRLEGDSEVNIPLNIGRAKLIYPTDLGITVNKNAANIKVSFPEKYMAAVVEIENN